MQRKWLEHAENILVIILNHILLVAVAITVLDLFQAKSTKLFVWSASAVIPCVLYFARVIGKPRAFSAPFVVVLLGICSILEKVQTQNDWEGYYLFFICFYLIGYFLLYFIRQFLEAMRLNEKSAANVPEEVIFKSGLKQMLVYCIGSLLVFFITANLNWLGKIMQRLGDIVLIALRWLFSKLDIPLPETAPNDTQEEFVPETESGTGQTSLQEFDPENMRKILIIFFAVTALIMFFVIVYLIYKYGKIQFQLHKKIGSEDKLQTNGDIREKCTTEKSKKKREGWFAFLSNREKVRRLYRKRMIIAKKELVGEMDVKNLEYLTAKECCECLSEENLKAVYEKARYSEAEITAEDVKQVRHIV